MNQELLYFFDKKPEALAFRVCVLFANTQGRRTAGRLYCRDLWDGIPRGFRPH